jgi:hypothetical protein
MFTLIAGAVFAQASVGGNLKISTTLIASGDDDFMAGGATIHDGHVNLNWSGDNAGGFMRLYSKGPGYTPLFTYWWWKPIDQLRIQLGKNADADWEHPQINNWGFNAEAQGGISIDQHQGLGNGSLSPVDGSGKPDNDSIPLKGTPSVVARTAAWWGGFSDLGLAISITPIESFEINIGIPYETAGKIEEIYLKSKINFNAAIPDVGNVRFAADLQGRDAEDKINVNVHFAFYLSAIENMGLEVGAGFKNQFKDIEAGLGFKFEADDLTFKARAGFVMPDEADKIFGIGILPSYNLGSLVFFFNAGFGMTLGDSDLQDWYANPYIKVPTSNGDFYAGIKAQGIKDNDLAWSIPIGWNVYF